MFGRFIDRHGPRNTLLITIGLTWFLMGLSVVLADPPETPISGVPHTYLPGWFRFTAWTVSGLVAIVAGLWRDKEHLSRAQSIGFTALYIMPAERTLSYLIAWISSTETVPGDGLTRGWVFSLQYLAYVAVIYIAAGWPDPRKEQDV